jgi:hypothetical protein
LFYTETGSTMGPGLLQAAWPPVPRPPGMKEKHH